MTRIYVDADACPVKLEVYRVARRNQVDVILVSNSALRIPNEPGIRFQLVAGDFDAADDWIIEHIRGGDIVITSDIPLAARCLEKGSSVLGNTGKPFTENNIGPAIAMRSLFADLRDTGIVTSGPPPIKKRDRSRFLQNLEEMIQALKR